MLTFVKGELKKRRFREDFTADFTDRQLIRKAGVACASGMHIRQLTRLTNAFSKILENFEAAMGLHFAYYNFCKMHLAIRGAPAMAAGVEPCQWSVAELVENCGE